MPDGSIEGGNISKPLLIRTDCAPQCQQGPLAAWRTKNQVTTRILYHNILLWVLLWYEFQVMFLTMQRQGLTVTVTARAGGFKEATITSARAKYQLIKNHVNSVVSAYGSQNISLAGMGF